MPDEGHRWARDPVSELFDRPARRLLERAYRARGSWVGTRLAGPSPRHVAYFAARGINVLGPDNAPTVSGRSRSMRTRWARGFARSLFHIHKWYASRGRLQETRRTTWNGTRLEVEVGRALPVLGVLPAGVAVRVRVGGRSQRGLGSVWDDGEPGPQFSDPEGRDWS